MRSRAVIVFSAVVVSAAGAAAQTTPAAAAPAVKPGLWETTTVIENAVTNSRRSIVARSCVSAADAANPQRIVPPQREPGMQCENTDVKRDGSSLAWSISCKSADGGQKGTGKMSVSAESYVGRAEVEQQKKGAKPLKLAQTFAGKWLQPCS